LFSKSKSTITTADDDEHSGQPSTSKTYENTAPFKELDLSLSETWVMRWEFHLQRDVKLQWIIATFKSYLLTAAKVKSCLCMNSVLLHSLYSDLMPHDLFFQVQNEGLLQIISTMVQLLNIMLKVAKELF
jgi:hypothetical protein